MNASLIKLLPIVILLLSAVGVGAQNPTEKELVPLILKLIDAPLGIDGSFGPQVLLGLHRNYVKVKVLRINDAETTDASASNTLRGIPEGQKFWPVRAYTVVSFNDPAKGESLMDQEDTCYAYRGKDGMWVLRPNRPKFKKSLIRSLREKISGSGEKP